MPEHDLEVLYLQAQSALKAKDYNRAGDLLTQILVVDENYKDVSRLLAQTVKLRRRRWYNQPLLWSTIGFAMIIALGFFVAPRLRWLYVVKYPVQNINNPTATLPPTVIATPTQMPLPTPTSNPLVWKRISMGLEFPRDLITALVIDPKDPDLMYVNTANAGIYRSIDGGISWSPDPDIKETYSIFAHQNLFDTAPDGTKRSYRYDGHFWNFSEDGEKTWKRFSFAGGVQLFGGRRQVYDPIAFDKLGTVYVFCDDNGSRFRSPKICKHTPPGELMKELGSPGLEYQSVIALSPKDPDTIYAAGDGIVVSRDGGWTWTDLNNGLGSASLILQEGKGNSNIFYLIMGDCALYMNQPNGKQQPLYRSLDGGSSWEFFNKNGCSLIQDADGKTVYRFPQTDGLNSWIWRSSNNGQRWDKINLPAGVFIRTMIAHPTRSGVLQAGGYTSENYGSTWKKSSQSIAKCFANSRQIFFDRKDENHVLCVWDSALYESFDGGATEKIIQIDKNLISEVNSLAIDSINPDILYAATGFGAYISYNGGQTWGQVNDGLLGATVVYSIVVDKDGNVYTSTPYGIFKLENK
jgi:hypothetical protein